MPGFASALESVAPQKGVQFAAAGCLCVSEALVALGVVCVRVTTVVERGVSAGN